MISNLKWSRWLNPKNYQLRSKLILTYLLLTAVPMSVLGYVSYYQYTRSIEEQVGEYVAKILDQVNENIDRQIGEFEHLPELLYNSSQVLQVLRKETSPNQSDFLNDRFVVNSYLSKAYFNERNTDLLGIFVWSKNRLFSSTKVSYSGFERELEIRGQTDILLPNETDLRFAGAPPYILIAKPIEDLDNRRILGTIYIAVQLSFIDNVMQDMEKQNNAEMWFMDEQGQIIYHTDDTQIGSVANVEKFPLLNGSFRTFESGERKLVSVSQSLHTNWALVHSISFKYLTEKTDLVLNVMIFLFGAIVMITSLISIFVAWSVSRPIHKLSRLMLNIEKANFQVDLTIDTKDEIGVLAKSFNAMMTRIRKLIQQNFMIELRQKQAELYALQSQINPHFMYNTLETISTAVEEEDKETVVEMVTLLGTMMRFSLSNMDRIIMLDKEVEHVNNYLTIQKYRFEDRLEFAIHSDIDMGKRYSPKFILQPIIENCIKHGLERRGSLNIRIHVSQIVRSDGGSMVIIRVQDDGTGIDQDTLAQIRGMLHSDPLVRRDSGFGLINVHARIVMMFGAQYGLTIQSEPAKGTDVVIQIPVIDDRQTVLEYNRKEDDSYRDQN